MLCILALITGFFSWKIVKNNTVGHTIQNGWGLPTIVGPFLVFGLTHLAQKRPTWSAWIAVPLAISMGVFGGTMSGAFEIYVPGIAVQCLVGSLSAMILVLLSYELFEIFSLKLKFLEWFVGIIATTVTIFLFYRIKFYFGVSGKLAWQMLVAVMLSVSISLLTIHEIKSVAKAGRRSHEWFCSLLILTSIYWFYVVIFAFVARGARKR